MQPSLGLEKRRENMLVEMAIELYGEFWRRDPFKEQGK